MNYRFILYSIVFLTSSVSGQTKDAYRIFTSEGKDVRYERMMKSLKKSDIVFFGEMHNDPISHWLELQVAKSLYEINSNFVLAMEMFEADNQLILDEYLQGMIDEKQFLNEAKLWDNYKTDYKPLVEFARQKKAPVIASNIPRRYANLVYRKGLSALDTLSDESKKWIAPLPIQVDLELKGYKKMIEEMGGHGSGNVENLARSQAVKDATMAYFILKQTRDDNIILHVNGSYHSQDGEGIIWYLRRVNAELKIVTIHVVEQEHIEKLEEGNLRKADFIIAVPKDMTKTY
jgi:uncharacterized iron-regulated protein